MVAIDEQALNALEFPQSEFKLMSSGLPGTAPGSRLVDGIVYLLLLNSQNFQFWDMREGQFSRYAFDGIIGANGMRRAFDRAWGNDPSSLTFRAQLTERGVAGLFGEISLPAEREWIFAEMLHDDQLEQLAHALAAAAGNRGEFALEDAVAIAGGFPVSYAEPYLKRAQLALAKIAGFCAELGVSVDCSALTLCADYQVPRMLRSMGVLRYAPSLAARVDTQTLIEKGSAEERAIRAATIVAGEMMAERFNCPPAAVDNFLWTNRARAGTTPFHLTITTAY